MEDIFDLLNRKETLAESIKWWPARKWQRIKDAYYQVKYAGQKITIGHSDMQVIEMYSELAHHIWPIIKDYKENSQGFPAVFSEYDENGGVGFSSREEYDEAIANGKMIGGGEKAWKEIVDKIIFAFEYIIVEDSSPKNRKERKLVKEFKEKYGDIWEEKEEYAHAEPYHFYTHKEKGIMHCPPSNYTEEKHAKDLADGWEYGGFKTPSPFYHNDKLEKELNEKCDEGLQLFGKWFRAFWL